MPELMPTLRRLLAVVVLLLLVIVGPALLFIAVWGVARELNERPPTLDIDLSAMYSWAGQQPTFAQVAFGILIVLCIPLALVAVLAPFGFAIDAISKYFSMVKDNLEVVLNRRINW